MRALPGTVQGCSGYYWDAPSGRALNEAMAPGASGMVNKQQLMQLMPQDFVSAAELDETKISE